MPQRPLVDTERKVRDDVQDSAVQSRYFKLMSCLYWLFVYLKLGDFLCETELIKAVNM